MTRDEKNRKLAEWLEPIAGAVQRRLNGVATRGKLWSAGAGWDTAPPLSAFGPAVDFFTSEEASALLLEKMPNPLLCRNPRGEWLCDANSDAEVLVADKDRQTAIAEAALALAEKENQ